MEVESQPIRVPIQGGLICLYIEDLRCSVPIVDVICVSYEYANYGLKIPLPSPNASTVCDNGLLFHTSQNF